jgi:hypothetical protein
MYRPLVVTGQGKKLHRATFTAADTLRRVQENGVAAKVHFTYRHPDSNSQLQQTIQPSCSRNGQQQGVGVSAVTPVNSFKKQMK